MEISIAILLAMLAAASPSILSIVGLAGGTIIVPALVLLFGLEARFAAGTTIFALIFSIFCARFNHFHSTLSLKRLPPPIFKRRVYRVFRRNVKRVFA